MEYDTGNDKYNIKSNKGTTTLEDKGGNDSYTIDKLINNFNITDDAGTDTLSLSKTKADNLIYMTNYNTKTPTKKNDVKDGTLFIFDKATKGYIQINNYFSIEYSASYMNTFISGKDTGCIETINAGKKDITSAINTYAESVSGNPKTDVLGEAVAGWLNTNSFQPILIHQLIQYWIRIKLMTSLRLFHNINLNHKNQRYCKPFLIKQSDNKFRIALQLK